MALCTGAALQQSCKGSHHYGVYRVCYRVGWGCYAFEDRASIGFCMVYCRVLQEFLGVAVLPHKYEYGLLMHSRGFGLGFYCLELRKGLGQFSVLRFRSSSKTYLNGFSVSLYPDSTAPTSAIAQTLRSTGGNEPTGSQKETGV